MTDSPIQTVTWEDKVAVVKVAGDIDLHRSASLQHALLGLLDEQPSKVVVDLSGVPYMDSSGVASLVKLLSRTRKLGVSLVLLSPSQKVKSIFEITRLNSVFTITDSKEEAMA
ncbi:MAG: STAS domain-containing protein [Phycisphaerae bacterium]|nr:STAS domain-containing protein [Phycisphaerae bacterium]